MQFVWHITLLEICDQTQLGDFIIIHPGHGTTKFYIYIYIFFFF